jgi:transposase
MLGADDQATKVSAARASLSADELRALLAEKEHLLAESQRGLAESQRQLEAKDELVRQKSKLVKDKEKRIALLEAELRLARQQQFGAKSEKVSFQGDFFDEAELEQALLDVEEELVKLGEPLPPQRRAARKRGAGFSDKLPRVRIELPLSDEQKAGASRTFFTKVKEELDIEPAKKRVLEYWQEKAVFDNEDGTEQHIVAAERPVHPLGKCMASVQLLAYLLVAKYADGLPLYRLEKILARYGGSISRTAMANWIIRLEAVLAPLIERLRAHQLSAGYLQADETRIQVLKESGHVATSDKWMWLVRGGPPGQPVVLFHYDPSRGESVPTRLLAGFTGVLQTDSYSGYNQVCRENAITRIGCWDHARRKFVEANKAAPAKKKGKAHKVSKAAVALSKIRKLYVVEQRIADLPAPEKLQRRQALAQPILDDLKAWLNKNESRVPKDSHTFKAIQYAQNQWEYLVGYLNDGRLHISNALAENAIRPFAVGRKNWLFADTSRGAHASATAYSLIETAKANSVEPYEYLRYVLRSIGTADSPEALDALLPWNMPDAQ